MKGHKTYFVFKNECVVCKCQIGRLGYQWVQNPPDKAYAQGHTINFFTCSACGAITQYESVPIVSGVMMP